MGAGTDWFGDLPRASMGITRGDILEKIGSILSASESDDSFSLEVRLNGYVGRPDSVAWAPCHGIHLVRRTRHVRSQVLGERLIWTGGPHQAKNILEAVAEAARERNCRLVVTYWREGFLLMRVWGSRQDKECETCGHEIIGLGHGRGDVRANFRCACGAMQAPDGRIPALILPCLFLGEFIESAVWG